MAETSPKAWRRVADFVRNWGFLADTKYNPITEFSSKSGFFSVRKCPPRRINFKLFSRDLEARFGYGLPRYESVERAYPFTIISPSSPRRINATFGHCALSGDREEVEINPVDAEPRGISDGDVLRVFNVRGETHLVARTTDAVLPGVLYTPKGAWLSASPTGQTVNALLDADIRTDIEDGACCNEAFCDVERTG